MTEYEREFLKFCSDIKRKLVPYKTNIPKFRLGKQGDGGYVCIDLPEYDCLYSLGSDNNIKFEKGFYERYKKECYVYDHTIDNINDKPDYINFFKIGIGPYKTMELDTIDNILTHNKHLECRNIMAQIDIEGFEWLSLRNTQHIKNFSQIIIEYHLHPYPVDIKEHIFQTLDFMNEHFYIVHIHGNNCLIAPWLDINFPRVFEVTYIRKDLVDDVCIETEPYPVIGLDTPNDASKPDMNLNWWLVKK